VDTHPCEKIVTCCAKSVTEKPVPTASNSTGLLRHYDTPVLGDSAHFMYHLKLLTLLRQSNVPYVTFA